MSHGPFFDRNDFGQFFDAFAANCGDLAPAKNFRRDKDNYLINDSGLNRIGSQVRPAFHKETLNLEGPESFGQFSEIALNQDTTWKRWDPASSVQNHGHERPAAGKAASIGKLRSVGQHGSTTGDDSIDFVAQVVNELS